MTPLLGDGDYAVVRLRRRVAALPAPGDVVLVDHPTLGTIVKCVGATEPDGHVDLFGLSPDSTSAAALGRVSGDCILGTVCWRIAAGGIARISRQPVPATAIG